MDFTNNIFILMIAIFFVIYFALFESPWKKKWGFTSRDRARFVAVSSILFYMTWYPPAVLLLFYHALLGKYGGRLLSKQKSIKILWFVLILALLPLFFFKYYDFFITWLHWNTQSTNLVLPLGLSFYTFSMIGYYVDIYQKRVKFHDDFLDILLFISFWPHLAAGPILRAKNIFTNVVKEERLTEKVVTLALVLIAVGLVKKLLIADNIGAYVNWNISYGIEDMSILDAWATMLGFSAQIYADFSGYSDMAIGFALLMGFKLPANFNYPYRATSLTDFWHRWHISLSTWFRDYLYFPLGGSKKGPIRTYINIMIVFILSGIWHGAGIGFAIWGAIHGFVLVLEKVSEKFYYKVAKQLRWVMTMLIVVLAWSFFRLEYHQALIIIEKMFGFHHSLVMNQASPYYQFVIFFMLLFLVLEHIYRFYTVSNKGELLANTSRKSMLLLGLLIGLALTFSGDPLPFIYFDF